MPVQRHAARRVGLTDSSKKFLPMIMVRVNTHGGMGGGQVRYCGHQVESPYKLADGGFGLHLMVRDEVIEINPRFVSEICPVRLWREELEHGNTSFKNPLVLHHIMPERYVLEAMGTYNGKQRTEMLNLSYGKVEC